MVGSGGTVQYMDGVHIHLKTKKIFGDASSIGITTQMTNKVTATMIVAMIETTTHPVTMMMEEEMEGQSEPLLHYQEEDKNIQQQTTSICYMYQERKPATVRQKSKAQAPSKRECRNIRVQ